MRNDVAKQSIQKQEVIFLATRDEYGEALKLGSP